MANRLRKNFTSVTRQIYELLNVRREAGEDLSPYFERWPVDEAGFHKHLARGPSRGPRSQRPPRHRPYVDLPSLEERVVTLEAELEGQRNRVIILEQVVAKLLTEAKSPTQ